MKKILILANEKVPEKFIIESFALGFESNNCKILINDENGINEEETSKFKPDMIFAYNYSFLKNPASLKIIKSLKCSNIVFYFDKDHQKNIKLYEELKKIKAKVFLSNKNLVKNPKVEYFLPLAGSAFKYATDFSGYKYSICFAGNPNKKEIIQTLTSLYKYFKNKIHIFCKKTDFDKSIKKIENQKLLNEYELSLFKKSYCGFVETEEELAGIYNSSKINLNFRKSDNTVNYRIFEILSSGGFLITERIPNLEKLFIPSKHLEIYENLDDLFDKINFYLKNLNLAQKVAQLGRLRCIEKHNYSARAKYILKTVF